MMATRIERIEIGAFGCLSDVVLTPASGVNLLEAPNEAGKSTLAAFIKFVLYGFSSTRSQSIAENEKKLYMPWNGTRASGSLVVVCPSGSFRVERTYDLPSKEHVEIVNLQTRKPVFQSLVPGEVLFGAPEELFVKSAYFRQLFQSKNGDDALAEQVQNILFSADERISAEKAQKRLREAKAEPAQRAEPRRHPRAGGQARQLSGRDRARHGVERPHPRLQRNDHQKHCRAFARP